MKLILTIDWNTFLWIKRDKGLIYNSSNYKSFEFILSDSIKKICESLQVMGNLYQVSLDESYKSDFFLKQWIDDMIRIDSARIEPWKKDGTSSLKPVLRIQHDIDKILKNRNIVEVVNSLKEITIHLNGVDISKKEEVYHKQFIYPIKSINELDVKKLIVFFKIHSAKKEYKIKFCWRLFFIHPNK